MENYTRLKLLLISTKLLFTELNLRQKSKLFKHELGNIGVHRKVGLSSRYAYTFNYILVTITCMRLSSTLHNTSSLLKFIHLFVMALVLYEVI